MATPASSVSKMKVNKFLLPAYPTAGAVRVRKLSRTRTKKSWKKALYTVNAINKMAFAYKPLPRRKGRQCLCANGADVDDSTESLVSEKM